MDKNDGSVNFSSPPPRSERGEGAGLQVYFLSPEA